MYTMEGRVAPLDHGAKRGPIPKVGDRVDLPRSGRYNCGTVRYRGPLKGVAGSHNKVYLGIELDESWGKNDGTVAGFRLFECEDGRGLFVRPQGVRLAASSETQDTSLCEIDENRKEKSAGPAHSGDKQQAPRNRRAKGRKRSALGDIPNKKNLANPEKAPPTAKPTEKLVTPARHPTSASDKVSANVSKSVSRSASGSRSSKKRNRYSASKAPTRSCSSGRMFRGKRIFDPSLSRIRGLKGLKNLGNTCFVNSVLQNISNLPPVRDLVLQMSPETLDKLAGCSHSSGLTYEMYEFVRSMWLANGAVISPQKLFDRLCSSVPRLGSRRQQDAIEALRYIFDGLDQEAILREKKSSTSPPKITALGGQNSPSLAIDTADLQMDPENAENIQPLHAANGATNQPESLSSPQPFGPRVALSGMVAKIFSGIMCSEIKCGSCGSVSSVKERFSDISLPIPDSLRPRGHSSRRISEQNTKSPPITKVGGESGKHQQSDRTENGEDEAESLDREVALAIAMAPSQAEVESTLQRKLSGVEVCLNHFTAPEKLEDRECDDCHERCNASRRYVFRALPEVLVLHVKRFAQTMTGKLKKLNTFVSYPETLDLSQYVSKKTRSWSGTAEEDTLQTKYSLCGVVVHGGTLHGGHYSAFVRRVHALGTEGLPGSPSSSCNESIGSNGRARDDPEWVYITDARMRVATKSEAMERHGAYLLFYCKQTLITKPPEVAGGTINSSTECGVSSRSVDQARQGGELDQPLKQLSLKLKNENAQSDQLPIVATSEGDSSTSLEAQNSAVECERLHEAGESLPALGPAPIIVQSDNDNLESTHIDTAGEAKKWLKLLRNKKVRTRAGRQG